MVVGYDGSTLGWVMSRNNFMDESLYENIMNELETKFKYINQFKKLLINDCVIKIMLNLDSLMKKYFFINLII